MRRLVFLVLFLSSTVCATAGKKPAAAKLPDAAELNKMASRLAPAELRVDISQLSAGDRKALAKLIEASRIVNDIFLEQLWSGNRALYSKLKQDHSALGRARLRYFWINKGPWSDLDDFKAFIPGVPERKLPGANFYPADMTKQEFENWLKSLPEKQREEAQGFNGVITRSNGSLATVPYSKSYDSPGINHDLSRAAALLKEAAALTENASLKKFLTSRAESFLSNDYYQSDIDWMDLDSPLDVTIGPYETYNDELFGYKAAFESYVNVRDDKESAKLAFLSGHLQEIENNLPEDPAYRNPKLGAAAPLRVVNEVFAAGDGDHGVKTAAYNLPNDDRVIALKGSKRVMLKNVQEAKFKSILVPIAKIALAEKDQKDLDFSAFFTQIVAHELTHGIGPHQIKLGNRETNPRMELKDTYAPIEEAKADITGLVALQFLFDHGELVGLGANKEVAEHRLYSTFLASAFRTLRFGTSDAHGKGMVVQFNALLEGGGFVLNPDGSFHVDFSKIAQAVRDLDHELLTVEAKGDYAAAKKMLDSAKLNPAVQKAIDRMSAIPTDIDPAFVTAEEIAPEKK